MLLCAGEPPTVVSAGQALACTAVGPASASCAPTADVPLKTTMGRGQDHLGGVLPCPGQHAELPPACHQQLCTENRKPPRPSVQDQCPLPSPEHLLSAHVFSKCPDLLLQSCCKVGALAVGSRGQGQGRDHIIVTAELAET